MRSRQTPHPQFAPMPMAAGTFPGVPPGTYYLMISAMFNKQLLMWGQAVQIHAGANSITLDARSATPLN